MLLKQIEYLQAIIEKGNFYDAAEKCYVSQSAISQQIKKLEEELGVKLLDRHNRTFTLTEAGEYFYKKSLVIINDINQMTQQTKKIANKDKKIIRIGYYIGYNSNELSEAITEFSIKYPSIGVQAMLGSHEELYKALEEDKLDIILNDQRRAFSNAYYNEILFESNVYIEISNQNPLSNLNTIEVSDLKNTPCILVITESAQQEEVNYYKDIIGINTTYLFAESLQEARIKILTNQGFTPIDVITNQNTIDTTITRIKLIRNNEPIKKNYCAFYRKDNSLEYIFNFAEILKNKFNNK